MSTPTLRHQLLAILLHELESAGYPLGTAKYLQVQELLRQAPADLPLEQWRGLLAPLFAGSPQEQEQFYALFDKSLELTRSLQRTEPDTRTETPPVPPEIIQKETRWRRITILLIALILLGIAGIWWFGQSNQPEKTDAPKASARSIRFSIPPGGDTSMLLRPATDTTPLLPGSARDWQATRNGGQYQVDSLGRASYRAATNASVGDIDSMLVILETAQKRDSIYWIADLIAQPEKTTPEKTDSLIAELPLPFPENADAFANLRIDEQAQKTYAWYQRWQWPIKAALLILLGLLAWAIARWDQYRRAKAIAELQRPDRAPYLWNPETGTDASAYLSADAQALLTRLRGRSLDERLRLDLPATVLASIRAAGRIQLRYRRQTLPPDFLLLIDRHDAQDHRARLFDALYQVFLRAEAPITRYFYDGDPRLCFNEAHLGGIALSELLHRHAGAQLLLVGDGQGLLSTLSGRVAPWTNLLQAWPRRALLQTRPLGQWARREKELQALLPLLPASPAGLGAAIDLFNSEDPTTLNPEVLKGIPDALQQPFAFAHELLPDLQRHFAQPYIDWIAACALWPTLHWDLTLYLGKVLADRGTGDMGQNDTGAGQARPLLDFAGIRELTRLPWFVEGRMPDAVRSILLEYLQARGLEQPLRLALRTLLEQAPPPPAEATAYDEYRMNLILNELFLQPDAAKKRALEREFARYIAAGKKPDFVALKLLNRPQTPLDVLVGDRLKKYAFREGLPGLGWQLLPKLLGIWAVLGLGLAWVQPFANPCAGEKVQYQQQTYCLQDKQDRLLYLEQLAADAIELQQHQRVDSLVAAADALQLRDTAFYQNTATRYYNYGARSYLCSTTQTPGCSTLPPDSLRALACQNFGLGGRLHSRLMGQAGVQYYLAQQQSCKADAPTDPLAPEDTIRTPEFFVLQGTILDALTQEPIVGATVQLNGRSTRTQANGQYQFKVKTTALGNKLELRASAQDYKPDLLRTTPQSTLPLLRLSPSDAKLERAAWAKAKAENTPEAYDTYLEAFPNGANAEEAKQAIANFVGTKESAAWEEAKRSNTLSSYQNFVRQYPQSRFGKDAEDKMTELRDDAAWATAQATNTPAACQQYLNNYPTGRHADAARQCANPPPAKVDAPRPAMVRIPAGSFEMGDVMGDKESEREKPVHNVILTAFELGRYEVTFAEYDLFCEATQREKPDDEKWGRGSRPVINVSWEDVVAYCNWLSEQHGYQPVYNIKGREVTANWNANGYRLPTEAEWEYAARGGGKKVRFGNGKDIADPKEINFDGSKDYKKPYSQVGDFRGKTVPVGSLNSPNALGLHDMSGNVYEWCWDWYDEKYYAKSPATNPLGPAKGEYRVLRGGSWYYFPDLCRASYRLRFNPGNRLNFWGFRLARH